MANSNKTAMQNKNYSATKKGPGRVHKDGFSRGSKRVRKLMRDRPNALRSMF